MSTQRCSRHTAHRGFSLVVVMIIMVVVSLLGVAASQMALLGERSARYDRDWQIAYQAAEAALMDAEFDIRGPNPLGTTLGIERMALFSNLSRDGFITGCGTSSDLSVSGLSVKGLCRSPLAGTNPIFYTVNFEDDNPSTARTVEFGEFTGRKLAHSNNAYLGAQPIRLPRYIIEDIPDQPPGSSAATKKVMYRVTAVGFGPRLQTRAVLQMFFRKE